MVPGRKGDHKPRKYEQIIQGNALKFIDACSMIRCWKAKQSKEAQGRILRLQLCLCG